jgi:molybdopterin-containing oxidoreductase family membrane subunit
VQFLEFGKHAVRTTMHGNRQYWIWMAFLTVVMLTGAYAYFLQLRDGLDVTGMNDHVSWGLYIANFTFLVGMASAVVMLVLPAYMLNVVEFSRAVLLAFAMGVAALVMSLAFVVVDIGNPLASWHLIPIIGILNFPGSLLAWDVLLLNGHLALSVVIPFYILYAKYTGRELPKSSYLPYMYLAVISAVSLHMVTAFLLSGLPARPFWNNALLGPRFLASAFTAGPAFILLMLLFVRSHSKYDVAQSVFSKLAIITAVAAQINFDMLASELFYKFYSPTHHGINARYLFFGLGEHNALVPWVWSAIGINAVATIALLFERVRNNMRLLSIACVMLFIGIYIEKGMGLVIPGFIPSPLGEIVEYSPTFAELAITAAIWAFGFALLTILIRVSLPIELGEVRSPMLAAKREAVTTNAEVPAHAV